jgi:glycerophosphoryl diester phosphodiesterase
MVKENGNYPPLLLLLITFFIVLSCLPATFCNAAAKIIIASGERAVLAGDTLPAITLAAAGQADYIEIHVMMTSDNELILFRNLTLDHLSNVAELFPQRSREDGSYYVADFSLREIQQIRLTDDGGQNSAPLSLAIPSLNDALSLVRRLESGLHRQIGIILEIKYPWFYSDAGKDISLTTLKILAKSGYTGRSSKLYIQCFDPEELQRINRRLLPDNGMDLPLIQLIGNNDGKETRRKTPDAYSPYNYDWLYTNSGLKMIAGYADVIGLAGDRVVDNGGKLLLSSYISASHRYGMAVFITSLNSRTGQFPAFADSFYSLLSFYLQNVDLDGFYTESYTEARIITDRFKPAEEEKDTLPALFSSPGLPPLSDFSSTEEKK